MYTGCETDRRVLRAATLEYRRVLFHRLCNGTRRPLELAAALLACGSLLAFVFALVAYLLFDIYAIARLKRVALRCTATQHCHCYAL